MIQRIQGLASLSSPEKEFGTGSSVGSKDSRTLVRRSFSLRRRCPKGG